MGYIRSFVSFNLGVATAAGAYAASSYALQHGFHSIAADLNLVSRAVSEQVDQANGSPNVLFIRPAPQASLSDLVAARVRSSFPLPLTQLKLVQWNASLEGAVDSFYTADWSTLGNRAWQRSASELQGLRNRFAGGESGSSTGEKREV